MKNDTVVMVPVLNEENAIDLFLERWTSYPWDILFVDGISRDQTVEKINAFRRNHSEACVEVVTAPRRQGLAANSCLGFEAVLERGYDFVVVADVGTQTPKDAEKLLHIARQQNPSTPTVPRGSYFLSGSKVYNFPHYRRFVSRGAAFVSGLVLSNTGTYPTHAFKVWPRAALEAIPFRSLLDGKIAHCTNGPEFQVGMTWLSLRHGWAVPEYPMEFHGTKSTFQWRWIPNYIRQLRKLRAYIAPKTSG